MTRPTLLATLSAAVVVLAAGAVIFAVQAADLRNPANRALVDVTATDRITERVSAGLKAVFSYHHTDLDRTERAADLALTGAAKREFRREFAAAAKRAERRELVRSSSVRSIGVRSLTEDRATLLVFLDQQELRPGKPATSSTATLDVTAVKLPAGWRIARIVTL